MENDHESVHQATKPPETEELTTRERCRGWRLPAPLSPAFCGGGVLEAFVRYTFLGMQPDDPDDPEAR